MFFILLIIALLMVVGEVFAARANRRTKESGTATELWSKVYRWRWVAGVPFAIASAFIYYPMAGETESYRVFGFPLLVAAFDEAGRDYVGPFTGPSLISNALIWYFMPHIFLFVWSYINSKR